MVRTFLREPIQDSDAKEERRKQTDWIAMMERKETIKYQESKT